MCEDVFQIICKQGVVEAGEETIDQRDQDEEPDHQNQAKLNIMVLILNRLLLVHYEIDCYYTLNKIYFIPNELIQSQLINLL